MTDKLTEALRTKCEEAANDWAAFPHAEQNDAYVLEYRRNLTEVIQHHIAPLVQSLRDEVIEECRIAYNAHNHVLNYPHTQPFRRPKDSTDECLECGLMLCDPVHLMVGEDRESRIRALKGVR